MAQLIDHDGRVLTINARLQASFGTQLPDPEFADFMVRNMGWVFVSSGRRRCEVRLRPSRVTDPALLAAIELLRASSASAFEIKWNAGQWSTVSLRVASEAVTQLVVLVDGVRREVRAADFVGRMRLPRQLAAGNPLAGLLEAWTNGERSAERMVALADRTGGARYVVTAREDDGDMSIVASGKDFKVLGPAWLSRVPRLRLSDWPDLPYGHFVAQAYREAWATGGPRLDELDCLIAWPQVGKRRHVYERLLLPCRSASGTMLVLGAMRDVPHVDLRAQVH